MSWTITPAYKGAAVSDPDAQTYLRAVETADGQPLEPAVARAVNEFVLGCKSDGIWTAIKASCILAGARTKEGAVVPLVNASNSAPTLNGTAGGWNYDRKTGLKANGTNNFINSGRSNSADPQNSRHIAVNINTRHTGNSLYLSTSTTLNGSGDSYLYANSTGSINTTKLSSNGTPEYPFSVLTFTGGGLYAANRSLPTEYIVRRNSTNYNVTIAANGASSTAPINETLNIFGTTGFYSDARLTFYSIGESLNLALLDARVTTLINAFAVAIP